MDPLLERLGRLFKSMFQGSDDYESPYTMDYEQDPLFREAMEELEADLAGSSAEYESRKKRFQDSQESWNTRTPSQNPELKAAYVVLGLVYGAPWEEVKKTHKALIIKNHPDRFASDPAAYKKATEYTQILNEAFQRLKKHFEP